MEEVRRIGKQWQSDAIRLDAWDAAAGAGEFYRKCGFREVGRVRYRNARSFISNCCYNSRKARCYRDVKGRPWDRFVSLWRGFSASPLLRNPVRRGN